MPKAKVAHKKFNDLDLPFCLFKNNFAQCIVILLITNKIVLYVKEIGSVKSTNQSGLPLLTT